MITYKISFFRLILSLIILGCNSNGTTFKGSKSFNVKHIGLISSVLYDTENYCKDNVIETIKPKEEKLTQKDSVKPKLKDKEKVSKIRVTKSKQVKPIDTSANYKTVKIDTVNMNITTSLIDSNTLNVFINMLNCECGTYYPDCKLIAQSVFNRYFNQSKFKLNSILAILTQPHQYTVGRSCSLISSIHYNNLKNIILNCELIDKNHYWFLNPNYATDNVFKNLLLKKKLKYVSKNGHYHYGE